MISFATLTLAATLIGAVCGVNAQVPAAARYLLPLVLALSVASWWHRRPRVSLALVSTGFALSAAILAADTRERALHSTLRALLEARYGHFALETLPGDVPSDPLVARFRIVEDAVPIGDVVAMRVAIVSVRIDGRSCAVPDEGVRLTISGALDPSRIATWRAGRIASAPILFRRPARYFDEGVEDAERALLLDGTVLFGSVKSGLLVDVLEAGSVIDEAAARVRAHVRGAVQTFVAARDPVAAGIVTAVLIGDRTGLPDDVRTRLQAAGTYHVIAISGGNIAIVAGLALGCLFLLRIPQRGAAALAIALLLFHAVVVTAGASVWRATIMAVIYLAARVLDHRTPPWQALAVAGVLIVVVHPLDVADAGFILTFGATAALLEGGRRTAAVLQSLTGETPSEGGGGVWRRVLRWVGVSMAASLAVEVALLPASAVLFSRVSLAGAVLNLIAVPLMGVVQVAGTLVACASSVPKLAEILGALAALSAQGIVESARLVDVLPWLAPRTPPPGLLLILAYYSGMALAVFTRRTRLLGGVVGATAAFCIVAAVPRSNHEAANGNRVRLTMVDVGQGEALLLEGPGSLPLLIDAGGAPFGSGGDEIGARVVTPALWARGVRSLGGLLITHGDPDHIGGAEAVLRDFAPPRLWLGIPVPDHDATRQLIEHARSAHVTAEWLRSGSERRWGSVRLRILNPPRPDWERRKVRNDDSVVLEVRFGDVSILLTGDISGDVERTLLPQLEPARVRILKVAHHGSRTSSSRAFVEAWRPQIAIISCGRGNRFGHPTADVLDRLNAIGAKVYRTDRDGEVTVESDGKGVGVRTWMEDHK